MGDFGISERAKQIAAAAIEGKYGAMNDDIDFDYDSPEERSYGLGFPKLADLTSKKFMIIGGVTLVLVAAAIAGGMYWQKKKKAETPATA